MYGEWVGARGYIRVFVNYFVSILWKILSGNSWNLKLVQFGKKNYNENDFNF